MLKLLLTLLLALPSLTTAFANADADATLARAARKAAEKIISVSPCLTAAWPGYDLKNLNIVFVSSAKDQNFAVSVREGKIASVNNSFVPDWGHQSGYFFYEVEGQKWMSVNAAEYRNNLEFNREDEIASTLFETAVHEGFHYVGQNGWLHPEGIRGTELPIRWEPRAYRTLAYRHMERALMDFSKSTEHLQKAAYWYDLWKKEFPREVRAATDGYEGTARYVEFFVKALDVNGCSANQQTLLAFLRREAPTMLGTFLNGNRPALDSEGYGFGGMASLLLRFLYPNEDWHQAAAKNINPAETLLNRYAASPEAMDPEIETKLKATAQSRQAEADKDVAPALATINSSDLVMLGMPKAWFDGSYSPKGFFVDSATGLALTPMRLEMQFRSPDNNSIVTTAPGTVFVDYMQIPCGGYTWSTPLLRTHFTPTQAGAKVSSPLVNGDLRGKAVRAANGVNWFCGE